MAAEFPSYDNPEEPFDFEVPDFSTLEPVENVSPRPQSFDEITHAATTLMNRQRHEQKVIARFLGEDESEIDNPIQKVADTYHTANLLQRIASPDAEIDIQQTRVSIANSDEVARIFAADDMTISEAKEALRSIEESTPKQELTDQEIAHEYKRQHIAIVSVAERHNCSYSEVLSNDDLYPEAIKLIESSEETAAKHAGQYNDELIEAIDRLPIPATSIQAYLDGKEILKEVVMAKDREDVEVGRAIGILKIVRVWGVDELETLSDEAKAGLGISTGIVERHLTRGAPQNGDANTRKTNNVLRTAFAKQFLTRLREDYNNPTPEGLRKLRQQPSWIRPLG